MNGFTMAKEIVANTPVDERPGLDEWFEFEGMDINVVGADYSEDAPTNGALVVVYPCRIPDRGIFPDHIMTFKVEA